MPIGCGTRLRMRAVTGGPAPMSLRPSSRMPMKPMFPLRLVTAVCAAALCAVLPVRAADECEDLRGTPIHFNVSWQDDIKPIINEIVSPEGRCTSCHGGPEPAGNLDLSDNGIEGIYKIHNVLIPGDPLASRVFEKINCRFPGGQQMPPNGDPLTRTQRELFYDWIAQGAYGEDPDGPDGAIFRDFMFRDGSESTR
jgi:hypothetical protein